MSELVHFENSVNEFVADSLQIAEATGKPHHVLMKAIRKTISKFEGLISQDKFILADYIDAQGKSRPKYLLTQKGVILLMSRMQDQLPWLIKLSNTFNKLQNELSKQLNCGLKSLRTQEQNAIDGREKIETSFGTSWKNNVPNEKKTIITYANIAHEHGMESTGKRVAVADFRPVVICDFMVEQSQRSTEGKIVANEQYQKWQRALHIAASSGEELPKPSYFGIDSKYEFLF
jgi:Rha family phage regulatory protein